MPLPLAPLAGLAVKGAAVALAALAARRALMNATQPGRTDQRAEDALDDLTEGLSVHRPRDRDQHNAGLRLRRRVHLGARSWDIDAGLIARISMRRA